MNDLNTHTSCVQLPTGAALRRTITAEAQLVALAMVALSSVACGSDGDTSSSGTRAASANPNSSSSASSSTATPMSSGATASTGASPTATTPQSGAGSTQPASGNSSDDDLAAADTTANGGSGGTGNLSEDSSSNVGGAGGQAEDELSDDDATSQEPDEPASLDDEVVEPDGEGAGGDGNDDGFGGAPGMDADDAGALGAGGSGTSDDPFADDTSTDDSTSDDDSSESDDGCPGAGNVEYAFNDLGAWPADAVEKITPALEEAVYYYNCYSDLSHSLTINYKESVQTAEANVDGWISFGSDRNYMVTATVMHEIGHTMGVGFYPWAELMNDGRWVGSHVVELMAELPVSERDDDETSLRDYITADGQHFWPYGLNYASEHKSEWSLINHVRIVAAMNRDKDDYRAR